MTWADVQEGIRVAMRDASKLPDTSVAWDIDGRASGWRQYPRIRLNPVGARTKGLPWEQRNDSIPNEVTLETVAVEALRVQVTLETERGSQGLGTPFQWSSFVRTRIRNDRIREALLTKGVTVWTVGDFTPTPDVEVDGSVLVSFVSEIQFQVCVPDVQNPEQTLGWFDRVDTHPNT